MPSLLIKYSYGSWYAMPANAPIDYKFAGETAEDQIVQVRALQEAMTQGSGEVIEGAPQFFDQVTEENAEEVVTQLFGTTDELFYQGALVFEVEGEATLLEEIVEVGEALGPFL